MARVTRIVIDLDDTITLGSSAADYADKLPNLEIVARLREYRDAGFEIVIHSARNMRTFAGSIGKITANTVPVIVDWLAEHDIPYDELIIGKPWCGEDGFYVDDRAIRPAEFIALSLPEIRALVGIKSPDKVS
ncbi:capsular biosynthesis protein [Polymorphobacter sp.]|uniref:capsular biosynthesis protein n=1 Tax=Polymorphobacter sp. TaxID=1909290 RepID=UPI003F6EF6A9